jgi:prepilin-type N-terminal cleavage/methylation domain-containing protein
MMQVDDNQPVAIPLRPGFTLMELTIAVAVLAVLLATSIKMTLVASSQVRANDHRSFALQAVQSIAEQIENIPWEHLPTATANQMPLPESAATHLPGAQLKITVNDETDPVAKRVLVEITWNGRGGERVGPVRLTTWVFPK